MCLETRQSITTEFASEPCHTLPYLMRSCQVMKATMVLFSSTYDALFRNAGVGLETWVTHW